MPDRTVQNMAAFMDTLRGMYKHDSLAFEVCVRHVAPMIEDQRRREGHTDRGMTALLDRQLPLDQDVSGAIGLAGDGAEGHRDSRKER